jgi:hypothetical protein
MSDLNSYLLEDCPLSGTLEVQPLKKNIFFGNTSNEQVIVFIIVVDEIFCNGI